MGSHRRLGSLTATSREARRRKGQFWTPQWLADAMVEYVLAGGAEDIFDPAVGSGAFLLAAKSFAEANERHIWLTGMELDRAALQEGLRKGLSSLDVEHVRIGDFLSDPPDRSFDAIVGNPPFIRHHWVAQERKRAMKHLAVHLLGRPLDGRVGLHTYFLLQALRLLSPAGRLAFILPADTFEGVSAKQLWGWVGSRFRLDAVLTFEWTATPFPEVDANPVVVFLRNANPAATMSWGRCLVADARALRDWVKSHFQHTTPGVLTCERREVAEAIAVGFTRPPSAIQTSGLHLGDVATVCRGIATGANDFFHLTRARAAALGIPDDYLVTAVGRTRDVPGDELTWETIRALEAVGRPTLLLATDGRPLEKFPKPVRQYLELGARLGLPSRPLLSKRRPWYKMEHREPPPILFAYLGRRRSRFIRNHAGVVPLTGFLCVYPRVADPEFVETLWEVLRQAETLEALSFVGKTYGGGAVKVEPRALENLLLPPGPLVDTLEKALRGWQPRLAL